MTALLTITSLPVALAEAWETGIPLAPPPADLLPADLDAAEEMAAEVTEKLGLAVCGVRVTEAGLLGPLPPARIAQAGATLAFGTFPHGRAAPALLCVLAEALEIDGQGPPALSALHPALDLSASRYQQGPVDAAAAVADLLGLGHVVIGAAGGAELPAAAGLGYAVAPVELAPLLARAAEATRRAGGLPAGAVLVLVLDGRGAALEAPGDVHARWEGLGTVSARLA